MNLCSCMYICSQIIVKILDFKSLLDEEGNLVNVQ